MNGETVTVPVFVQPDSTQECPLGANASISLGFKFINGKGRLSGLILSLILNLVLHRSLLSKLLLFPFEKVAY